MIHHCQDLITIFDSLFATEEQTILIGGGEEPLYQPQTEAEPLNKVIFTQDYYASALHEIAHWCLAGEKRRRLIDYGYWYRPDGRSETEQRLFEQVEIKPQAIEWLFSLAAGFNFNISLDNLTGNASHSENFLTQVYTQAKHYLSVGVPLRAELFKEKLLDYYVCRAIYNEESLASEFRLKKPRLAMV